MVAGSRSVQGRRRKPTGRTDRIATSPDSRRPTKSEGDDSGCSEGQNIVQKVTILSLPGLPRASQTSQDRPARPPRLLKVTKVLKVTILTAKVAYSQAGILARARFCPP